MDKRVLFLQRLVSRRIGALKPQFNLHSPYGFFYPEAQEVFGVEPGGEIDHLHHLAELGHLDQEFFERIHLCCYCKHHSLNFREVCPSCGSSNAAITDMLHHYRCGYIGPESEFKDGIRYTCPKCNHGLRHIGIDYERPSTNYACGSCRHIFTDPKISCQCLHCGQAFDVSRALNFTLYTYRITAQGTLAAAKGEIETATASPGLVDATLDVYTSEFFEERLAQELASVRRYRSNVSVMLLSLDNLQQYEAKYGKDAAAQKLHDLVGVVKEGLRDSDIASVFRDDVLAVLLTHTPMAGASNAANRLRTCVLQLNKDGESPKVTLSAGIAAPADEQASAKQIIQASYERLEEAKRTGNCTVPQGKLP